MRTIYTNQGIFFGYIKGKYLYTFKGVCAGKFDNEEIYNKKGVYIGEISRIGYLVNDPSKKNNKISSWEAPNGESIPMQAFQIGRIGVGSIKYIDFNDPEDFK